MLQKRCTVDSYLAFEEPQEACHECVAGVVYETPGATVAHSIIRDNLVDTLRFLRKPTSC